MRHPLAFPLESRDGSSNKDARYTNVLIEAEESGKVVAANRPGLTLRDTKTGFAGGMVSYDDRLITVYGTSVSGASVSDEHADAIYYLNFDEDLDDKQGNLFTTVFGSPPPVLSDAQVICGDNSALFGAIGSLTPYRWGILDSTPANIGLSDFDLEFWIFIDTLSGYPEPSFTFYVEAYAFFGGYGTSVLGVTITDSAIDFGLSNYGSIPPSVITYSGASLTLNDWLHVAINRSGSDFSLYLDGVLAGTGSSTAYVFGGYGPNNSVYFEARGVYVSDFLFTPMAKRNAPFSVGCLTDPIGTVANGFYDFVQGTT